MKDETEIVRPATMPPPERRGGPWNGLSLRIVVLLSLALLPLGLLAVLQTSTAMDYAVETYRANLAAQTARAAQPERASILNAFGMATALAGIIATLDPDSDACQTLMEGVADSDDELVFVGYSGTDLISRCNNMGEPFDFSANAAAQTLFAGQRPLVSFHPVGQASGLPVVAVNQPVLARNGDFRGFITLSFLSYPLAAQRVREARATDLQLVLFNQSGEVVMADLPLDQVSSILPTRMDLASLIGLPEQVFSGQSLDGQARDFALVPIVPGRAYALGSWKSAPMRPNLNPLVDSPFLFPFLMWLVTLAIAIWAMRYQVILPIRILRMRIRSFADGRSVPQSDPQAFAPAELREIRETFEAMADKILHDEADLENQVHERELLLREVHHRVKNNLQLMSSIINMQIRQSTLPEARSALRRVQGRLASLAKFHQDLYSTSSLSRLRADQLIEGLARQMLTMGGDPMHPIDLRFDMGKVTLTPDQASPLAMLATEALTNAMKYARGSDGKAAIVRVALNAGKLPDDASDLVVLTIENSVTDGGLEDAQTGLGSQLIKAFALQLQARIDQWQDAGIFHLSVSFERASFDPLEDGTAPDAGALTH